MIQKEIAIIGGTYDPPTLAHEAIFRGCLQLEEFAEVWVMPSGVRRDKQGMLRNASRLAMLELVKKHSFDNDERLVISDFEQSLPQPTQTTETVTALDAYYPNNTFRYVYGSDSYNSMPGWKDGPQLQARLPMLLIPRPGAALPPESEQLQQLVIPDDRQTISSTEMRQACLNGGDIRQFTSYAVAQYIMERGLYQPSPKQESRV